MRKLILLTAMVPFLAPTAGAGGGVLEINQACAVHTGCFSGDDPDWPVQITASGSYVLTSNLVLPDSDATGISLSAPGVSIDLAGFEIVTTACLGALEDCTPDSGDGGGIDRGNSLWPGTSVKNGTITGMGRDGVRLGNASRVADLRVRWNRYVGIVSGSHSVVTGNTSYENGNIGIGVSQGSTVTGNSVYKNGLVGIYGSAGVVVSDNTVYASGDAGIQVGSGGTVSGNAAYLNAGSGIRAGSGSAVQGNSVSSNGDYGLDFSGNAAYLENVVSNNTVGGVSGGVNRGGNYCEGTGVISEDCP